MVRSQRFWINRTATVGSQWSTIENFLNCCHQRSQRLSRTNPCLRRTLKIFLTERIMRSQTPPTCDAPEKLNFHLILFWCRKTSIFCLFQLFEASRISLGTWVHTIVTLYHLWRLSFSGKYAKTANKRICFERLGHFNMDCSNNQAGQKTP